MNIAATQTKPNVLCVDDEQPILEGLNIHLHRDFTVTTFDSPKAALFFLGANTEIQFHIILADMRMPEMDGPTFLQRAAQIQPNAIRLLLTGHSALEATIRAVNEGKIYKYISKPCPAKKLREIFQEAHNEFLRVEAERETLKETLRSSVQVLVELLGTINPTAFGCATRVQRTVKQISTNRFQNTWQFELAALLSQIGCVTVPLNTLNKVTAGKPLSEEEERIFSNHPRIAENFLRQIPRLEEIASMVANQQKPPQYSAPSVELTMQNRVELGAQLLRVAIDFDHLLSGGFSHKGAIAELQEHPEHYDSRIVALLETVTIQSTQKQPRYVHAHELSNGMIIDEEITSLHGVVLVSSGTEVTFQTQNKLRRFAENGSLNEPFRVLIRQ